MDIHQVHSLNVPEVCLVYVQFSSEKDESLCINIYLMLRLH
jgi:hypothetical protein